MRKASTATIAKLKVTSGLSGVAAKQQRRTGDMVAATGETAAKGDLPSGTRLELAVGLVDTNGEIPDSPTQAPQKA